MLRRLALILGICASLGLLPRATHAWVPAARQRCFADKSPFCYDDPFAEYWEANGGLPVFGYPIAGAANETNPDTGQTYLTQWAERNRFEAHPENDGTPYAILLGLLGKERLAQLGRGTGAREAGPQDSCLWFEQTGHNVCNQGGKLGFRAAWESHGLNIPGLDTYGRSLQLFGLPLTAAQTETNANGDTVLTQWFERARLEWHPGNPDEFKVLLGLLGSEARTTPAPIPAPLPVPQGNPCVTLPVSDGATLTPDCFRPGDLFTLKAPGFTPGKPVGVYVTTPDGSVIPFPAVSGSRYPDENGLYSIRGGFPKNAAPGIYAVTIQDTHSPRVAVGYFQIYTPTPGDEATVDHGRLPPSDKAQAIPDSGPAGSRFETTDQGQRAVAYLRLTP